MFLGLKAKLPPSPVLDYGLPGATGLGTEGQIQVWTRAQDKPPVPGAGSVTLSVLAQGRSSGPGPAP